MLQTKRCVNCEKEYKPNNSRQKYCCAACNEADTKKGNFTIFCRDSFKCVYCGKSPAVDGISLVVDHILPISAGGKDEANNLATSCSRCNLQKAAKVIDIVYLEEILSVISERNKKSSILDNQKIKLFFSAEKRIESRR